MLPEMLHSIFSNYTCLPAFHLMYYSTPTKDLFIVSKNLNHKSPHGLHCASVTALSQPSLATLIPILSHYLLWEVG